MSLHMFRMGVGLIFALGLWVPEVVAQTLDSGTPNASSILEQIQQQNRSITPSPPPATQTLQSPPAPLVPAVGPSRIELILSDRAGLRLRQFGYDVFSGLNQVTVPQVGAIQGYYVLGPGDALQVSLRGQENANYDVVVGNDGNVTLPKLPPIRAAGRSFSDFQTALQNAVKQAYIATTAYVSVGQLRRVSVTVSGEVNAPGVKMLTGLSSPLDALILSLGVKKSGSLRNIKILRAGRTINYDLYHVLLNDGSAPPVLLADGDRIVVPVMGKVAAVSGWVRRPGIYELAPGQSAISVPELLRLGGGLQVRGKFRYSLMATDADGRQNLMALSSPDSSMVRDADILFVEQAASAQAGQFQFYGPTTLAGSYSLSAYRTLADLLRLPGAMGDAPYMLLGLISRQDQRTLQRNLISFSPRSVRDGAKNIPLESGDIVRVFNVVEFRKLTNAVDTYVKRVDVLEAATRSSTADSAATTSANAIDSAVQAAIFGKSTEASLNMYSAQKYTEQPAPAPVSPVQQGVPPAGYSPSQNFAAAGPNGQLQPMQPLPEQAAPVPGGPFTLDQRQSSQGDVSITGELRNVAALGLQIGIDPAVLISFLADHRVALSGAVRGPGTFLVGDSVTLDALLAAAGGTVQWADMSVVHLSRTAVDPRTGRSQTNRSTIDLNKQVLASIAVEPRDDFRFNPVFTDVGQGTVTVQGEVMYPGSFDLVRGQRLSEALKQAGGLTREAYPYGAVFLRNSAAKLQQVGFSRSADDIEKQLVMAMAQTSTSQQSGAMNAETAAFLQGVVQKLRATPAQGRVTVVADPAMLATHPEMDVRLEPGDFLFIPSRPSSVTVVGEVLNAGSYPQKPDADVSDYIAEAGGYGRYADESYVYVINPDGSSRAVGSSMFRFKSDRLAPGALIVVPRDLQPLNLRQLTVDLAKIMSDLAVAAASFVVISR